MKISELKSHDLVVRERRAADPSYAAEADRLALAGAVSVAVVEHRAVHGLSRARLAGLLGWEQARVDEVERGDISPSPETLRELAEAGVLHDHVWPS